MMKNDTNLSILARMYEQLKPDLFWKGQVLGYIEAMVDLELKGIINKLHATNYIFNRFNRLVSETDINKYIEYYEILRKSKMETLKSIPEMSSIKITDLILND